jgi:hypothetical protein
MIAKYNIDGTINYDQNPCFNDENTYPNFESELEKFKLDLLKMVNNQECKTFFKFGDGDYFFLKKQSVGSASPGKRALSKNYNDINFQYFEDGCRLNDYYTCEIYPENRKMFTEVIPNISIDYPAEYGYGLVSNKWFFKTFSGRIGLIGGKEKIDLIKKLMSYKEYQEYLGIEKFNDYISIPQKYACDNLISIEEDIANQLRESSSDIFLIGIGHVKSGLTHRLKKYKNSVFFDIGSGIDAIAGIIDINRPYFGNWINYQIKNDEIYNKLDYLNYNGLGTHKFL